MFINVHVTKKPIKPKCATKGLSTFALYKSASNHKTIHNSKNIDSECNTYFSLE